MTAGKVMIFYLGIGLALTCIVAPIDEWRCGPRHLKGETILVEAASITLFWPVALAIGIAGPKRPPLICEDAR